MKKGWKRGWAVLIAGVMGLTMALTGCAGGKKGVESFIEPAAFSEEEKALLELLGVEENRFFDYTLGENVEEMAFHVYRLADGEWKLEGDAGSVSGFLTTPATGRAALVFDRLVDGMELRLEGAKFRMGPLEQPEQESAVATAALAERRAIEGDVEIPLIIQVFSENTVRTFSADTFDRPEELEGEGYLGVYAVTVSFEGKK